MTQPGIEPRPPIPKGISLKVNVIAWLGFELVYYDAAVQHVYHYARGDYSLGYVACANLRNEFMEWHACFVTLRH